MFKRYCFSKSNCTNTLQKFYDPEKEFVFRLNFFDSNSPSLSSLNAEKLSSELLDSQISLILLKESKIRVYSEMLDTSKEVLLNHQRSKNVKSYGCKDRLENITFEQRLENNRKKIEMNIELFKVDKQKLEKDLEGLVQVIREITIELELLENYGKYFNEEEIWKSGSSKKNVRKTLQETNELKNLIRLNRRVLIIII